jgi:hypothetical protein
VSQPSIYLHQPVKGNVKYIYEHQTFSSRWLLVLMMAMVQLLLLLLLLP